MKFDDLKQYKKIGWDFDNTLIDSPISPLLHEFIRNNPQIHHYIITFRSHALVTAIPFDLKRAAGPDLFDLFTDVYHIPAEMWIANEIAIRVRQRKSKISQAELDYRAWKGKTCKEHDIPILIDDDIKNTKLGCKQFGIILVDPLTLTLT